MSVGHDMTVGLPTVDMSPRIVFFPGLGCDHRMVEPNRGIHLPFDVPEWLPPLKDESLADYAKRMAATIDPSTPFYLAGVSLGGMIAQEVARHLPCRGLILLAACRSSAGVPFLYRQIGRLASRAPRWLAWPTKRVMPRVRILFGMKHGSDVALFEQMLGDADVDFILWSLKAVQDWPGVGRIGVPTLSIHGTIDHVLPRELAGPVDYAVEGAGHVMNVTHAAEVNAVVNTWLESRGERSRAVPSASFVDNVAQPIFDRDMPEHSPKIGQIAPDFTLPDENNQPVRLGDYKGKSPVVIYFYPKADTPGCTKEACGFRDAIASYKDLGVPVFGISPDPVADVKAFSGKFNLNFPLLADADHKVTEAYGCWVEKNMYGKKYMGAARTTFIINKAGQVAHVFEKVNAEGHDQEVLEWLKANRE